MARTIRSHLVFLLAALAIGGAVWLTATAQRSTATARAHRLADAQELEDTTLYQELEAGLSNEAPAHRLEGVPTKEGRHALLPGCAPQGGGGGPALPRGPPPGRPPPPRRPA